MTDHISLLLMQNSVNTRCHFARHSDNGLFSGHVFGVPLIDTAVKFLKFRVFTDSGPGCLDELASQSSVPVAGDAAFVDVLSRRILPLGQSQKTSQLPDVTEISPVADSGEHVTGGNPSQAGDAGQKFNVALEFRLFVREAADFLHGGERLPMGKVQAGNQLIELEADSRGTRDGCKLSGHLRGPLASLGRCGEGNAFK